MVRSRSLILLLSALGCCSVACAQLIDTKDASYVSLKATTSAKFEPADSINGVLQEGDCFIEHYDGFVKRKHPEKLRLEIVKADTHFAADMTEIVVTIRIRNEGSWPALLPWQTDPVVPASTGRANDEVSYEAGSLRLTLGTQENRAQGAILEGKVELQAVPHSYEQHVRLRHGQWVEVQFKAVAKCWLNAADPPLCSEFKADEHARLTAQYREWLFKHQGEGCKTVSGSDKARDIKSDPVEIDFVPADSLGTSKDEGGSLPRENEKQN